jgi:hypothetical protein
VERYRMLLKCSGSESMACVVSLGEVMMEGSTSKRGDLGGTCAFSGVDDGDQNAAIFGPSRTCDVECRRMQHGGHSCNLDMTSTAVKEQMPSEMAAAAALACTVPGRLQLTRVGLASGRMKPAHGMAAMRRKPSRIILEEDVLGQASS